MNSPDGSHLPFLEGELKQLRQEPYQWFVLLGDRLLLAGLLTFIFALGVVALIVSGTISVRSTTNLVYLFQGLAGGNFTLLTIVLSINQLVLSREFGSPGDLEDRIDDASAFRNHTRETARKHSMPVTPSGFLLALFDGMQATARRLGDTVEPLDNDHLVDDVNDLTSELTASTDRIKARTDASHGGIFSALIAALERDLAPQLNEIQRLQTAYEPDISPSAEKAFDDLTRSLKQIDVARQYFKSIYVQSHLARLSRILLYVGVPAVGSALLLTMVYGGVAGASEIPTVLPGIVPIVVILGFSPLAILMSFVLRFATIAQRTVAITPFTTSHGDSKPGK